MTVKIQTERAIGMTTDVEFGQKDVLYEFKFTVKVIHSLSKLELVNVVGHGD